METVILTDLQIDSKAALAYGFTYTNNMYFYQTNILDEQFTMLIRITCVDQDTACHYKLTTEIIDNETGDSYNVHIIPGITGAFVGTLKAALKHTVCQILDSCFIRCQHCNSTTFQIIEYLKQKYGDSLEHPWKRTPNNAICRRKDNAKWYLALLTIQAKRLPNPIIQAKPDNSIEIINLRIEPEELDRIVDNRKYFRGYHMNKRRWITLCLDGQIPMNEIYQRIDQSYNLAARSN